MTKRLPVIFVAAFLVVLATGFLSGFIVGRQMELTDTQSIPASEISPNGIAEVHDDFLESSTTLRAYAAVEGFLVSKSDGEIILEREGDRTVIPFDALHGSVFYDPRIGETGQVIAVSDIPLETYLSGTVALHPDGSRQGLQFEIASYLEHD